MYELKRQVSIPHWIRLSYSVALLQLNSQHSGRFQSHIGYDSATQAVACRFAQFCTQGFNPTLDTTQLLSCPVCEIGGRYEGFNPTLDTTQLLREKAIKDISEQKCFNPTLDTTQLLSVSGKPDIYSTLDKSFNPTLNTTQLLSTQNWDGAQDVNRVSIPHWIRLSYSAFENAPQRKTTAFQSHIGYDSATQ